MGSFTCRELVCSAALSAMVTLMACGCGSRTGTVNGKAIYHGEPLTSGLVIFVAADGKVAQPAGIEVDGSYIADNVPIGQQAICVETHPVSGGDGGGKKDQPRPRYVPLPEKYKDAKQSGLTFDVKAGRNIHDIVLD